VKRVAAFARYGNARLGADFRRLWLATSVSELGTQVSQLAIPLAAISLLHATALEVGVLAAAGYLPLALFGLPAGAWVDRVRRRRVLMATDLSRAVVLASIPVAHAFGHLTIAQLCVVALVVGGLSVFFDVAYASYLPSLVGRADLARGNSRLQVSEQGAAVLGPGLAGWLIGLAGAPFAIATDAASYLGSALFVNRIRHREPPPDTADSRPALRSQIAEGLRCVFGKRSLRGIAIGAALINLFGRMMVVVLPIYLVRSVGYSPAAIGVVFALGAVGFLLGAGLADRVIEVLGVGLTIVTGGTVAAAALLLLAVPPASIAGPFIAAGMFIYGVGALNFTIANATLRQLTTPAELLGRTTASMRFLVWVAQPVAALLAGVLASRIGLHATLLVGAIGALSAPAVLLSAGLVTAHQDPETHAARTQASPTGSR
jgi:MFS family permease